MNILTDIGGVTVTFDKERRKELWKRRANEALSHVRNNHKITGLYPDLETNPYAQEFGLGEGYDTEFEEYARTIQTGDDVLSDMLLDPTATALLEHVQGAALRQGELVACAAPGVGELMDSIMEERGVFRGYSTGARYMPDQLHETAGLHALVGKVRTTFPQHLQRHKSHEDIVDEARALSRDRQDSYHAFIEDSDSELVHWMRARERIGSEGLDTPQIYLLKRGIPDTSVGLASTGMGIVAVINSIGQVREDITCESRYRPDFERPDGKW